QETREGLRQARTSCRFSAHFRKPGVGVWLFFSSLRIAHAGKYVAQTARVTWILWSALLTLLATATVVYAAFRRDVAAARAMTLSESRILNTRCGQIEYASCGVGSPVLVLHGTSGGWDQGL